MSTGKGVESQPEAARTHASTPANHRAESRAAMAVLCLSESLGGLEINTIKFSGWMRERGWPITLLVPPESPLAEWAAREHLAYITVAARRKSLAFTTAWRLAQYLRAHSIRLLLVTQNKDLGFVMLLKLLMGNELRIVYQQHMQIGIPKRDWFHTKRFALLDAWLSPLPGLARQVAEMTRFEPGRVHVVPLGIDLHRFVTPGVTQAQAREQLQLPAETALLGVLGRFDDGKGQDFVLEVLHQLRTQHQQAVELVLMGELTRNEGDAYWQQLQAQITRLGLEQQVHIRPFSSQTEVFYRAIDVFVLASVSETYGMVTIEAMASGLPVVASATGGTLEIVQDGQTGLLYPLRDVQACVQQVLKCLQQPALRQELGQSASRRAQAEYSHVRQCELTEQVLLALV
ncbi:glycosyltransferase family 4 protein [Hymenobacter taeanensis]|uniref:Glycosyltransferase family 4 protein n=1 Tax=Hymenobacter taeanensis TaxID=2735321 RepID=A0A6M6BJQ5_9BACT|nr:MULTISPECIES: glycosyltransferase family 4 protein [Hymenobacter]QJX48316.1 glycosyltransferase family 4 protein [Hymenobacter taeanensis]UOQ82193.1 glycosyltransferase family 4 protein [Hymenobacter sp. 5414T-23]